MNTYQKRAPDCRIRSFSSEKVQYFFSPYLTYADEPDAFPFRGSEVLHGIAETSRKGHMICLSATPDQELLRKEKEGSLIRLVLNRRPHGHPLPVPEIKIVPDKIMFLALIRWLHRHRAKSCMVFVPSIKKAQYLYWFLSLLFPCCLCTSHTENRDEVISGFRQKKNGVMLCTTVMERGLTIENVQVCVYQADSRIFDEASLVQMAGRAGRTLSHPDGDVLFLCRHRSGKAEQCAASLQEANACAA